MIIETIAAQTGLPRDYVASIIRTASHRYKTYQIPKKTGGMRTIHHPARELKFLQRWVSTNALNRLPVHQAAFAYRNGKNIGHHASRHTGNNFLLKVDFEEFFPSITGTDILKTLTRNVSSLPLFAASVNDLDVI